MEKSIEFKGEDNTLYHDTLILLKKYRDVTWSLEVSVQSVKRKFKGEYGNSIEDFLESMCLLGVDLNDDGIADRTQSIEKSYKMIKLIDDSTELIRKKHKNGETYYWILYYCFLSDQKLNNADEIIEQLRPHIIDISYPTLYRKRKEAINLLSAILWGYSSRESINLLEKIVI